MPLDPDKNPKDFIVLIIAVGLKVFANKPWSDKEHFEAAERFVEEAEKRYGKLNQ